MIYGHSIIPTGIDPHCLAPGDGLSRPRGARRDTAAPQSSELQPILNFIPLAICGAEPISLVAAGTLHGRFVRHRIADSGLAIDDFGERDSHRDIFARS